VRECLKGRNEKDRVSAQQMINDHPRLVLLGDPGSGKTTLVNFIAHLLARAKASQESEKYLARLQKTGPWDHGSMLPIRIVLRDYAAWLEVETSESKNLSGWLQESLKENKLQKLWPLIHKGLLAENQQIFIMLDGLDEVPVSQRRNVVTQINNFAENYCHNRYLVTCRIYAYVDKAYQLGNFSRTILAPFSKDQINHFNDAWYQELAAQKRPLEGKPQELAARLKTAVKGDDLLELAERPLILTVIALLHTSYGQLPEDRVELYKWAVELLLRRWKGPEGGNSLASFLGMPKLKMSGLEAGLYEVAFQAHSGQTH
ncbi:MAG: NACHT domain-containing protein, partial [Desulfobulbaceae bacterium]|nr:NACHT domain-containing protein [Desulfobulbaceae bacterium]